MSADEPATDGKSTGPPAISADNLTKRYGQFHAVDGVSFSVADGETIGFFGPNGAGKSTTIRMLAGLVRPTAGSVRFGGVERSLGDPDATSGVGVVTHDAMLYDDLTARENLQFHARLHGVDGVDARVETVLNNVGLADRGSQRPATFSHGLQKRLSLARALLHDPDVLLLDEPYSGLDQRGVADLGHILDGIDDRTVLLSTHNLNLGLQRCSRALVLDRGRVQADIQTASTSPDEFEAIYRRAIGLDGQSTDNRSTATDQQ
ncbi:ABC transporter ATP-binding protein [Halobacterium noricense]|uniref:ABC transporter ATP-binding protein n=1 Tax=Halobacterium noricense TaxID=223182 RepID=UPI001E367EA7|nr:ABC transporter ATP-binding protein [Halobacterium noricense]UHH27136.1 ABC transporter ATP-binding protein [Halobacterium noricense]